MIFARSAAEMLCTPPTSSPSNPFGVTKCASVHPIYFCLFIHPPGKLRNGFLARCSWRSPLQNHYGIPASGNIEDPPDKTLPLRAFPDEPSAVPTAFAEAVTRSFGFPFSSARMQVMIFVVLAIGRITCSSCFRAGPCRCPHPPAQRNGHRAG